MINDEKETFKVYICEKGHINYVPLLKKIITCNTCGSKDCKFQQAYVELPKRIIKI